MVVTACSFPAAVSISFSGVVSFSKDYAPEVRGKPMMGDCPLVGFALAAQAVGFDAPSTLAFSNHMKPRIER